MISVVLLVYGLLSLVGDFSGPLLLQTSTSGRLHVSHIPEKVRDMDESLIKGNERFKFKPCAIPGSRPASSRLHDSHVRPKPENLSQSRAQRGKPAPLNPPQPFQLLYHAIELNPCPPTTAKHFTKLKVQRAKASKLQLTAMKG